eukprot:jgi/Ulvmu1/6631/UM003_0269.1
MKVSIQSQHDPADTNVGSNSTSTCTIRLGHSGDWEVDGSSVPLRFAALRRCYAIAHLLKHIEVGDVIDIPVSYDGLRLWFCATGAAKGQSLRQGKHLIHLLQAVHTLDDPVALKDVCIAHKDSMVNALAADEAQGPVTPGASCKLRPGTFPWAKQILLSVPDPVCVMLIRTAFADAVHACTFHPARPIGLLPQLADLPKTLCGPAVRACAPSIDSKHIWSISLNNSDLGNCSRLISRALPSLTSLTALSFTLRKLSGDPEPPAQHAQHTGRIGAAIPLLPSLSHLFLTAQDLPSSYMCKIIAALPQTKQLAALHLRCACMTAGTAAQLQRNLPKLPQLHTLAVTVDSELSRGPLRLLALCLSAITTLRSLHISHPSTRLHATARLLEHISHLPLHSLTLRCPVTFPGRRCGHMLMQAIGRVTTLTDLSIATSRPISGIGVALLQHSTALLALERLCLCGPLDQTSGQPFYGMLGKLCLQELQVSGPPLSMTPGTLPYACMLDMDALNLSHMGSLTSLDLSDISTAALCAMDALASLLQRLHELRCFKWINLRSERCVKGAVVDRLALAIAGQPRLEELHMSAGPLAERVVQNVHSTPLQKAVLYGRTAQVAPTLDAWARRFRLLRSLVDVRLIGVCWAEGAAGVIAPVLACMTALRVLVLTYASIDADAAAALRDALWPDAAVGKKRCRGEGLRRLRMLGLGGCRMDAAALTALAPALLGLAGCRLEQVMLWGNAEDAVMRVVRKLLEVNPDITIDAAVPGLP